MKCLKCRNTKYFISFFNQNVKIELDGSKVKHTKRMEPEITDIYPIICQRCQSEDVAFSHTDLKEIIQKTIVDKDFFTVCKTRK